MTGATRQLVEVLRRFGATVVELEPSDGDAERILAELDGLVLGPGADLSPQLYRQPAHDTVVLVPEARQAQDLALVAGALDRDLPVLGVCLGSQEIAVALGGSLVQDIPSQVADSSDHRAPHTLAVAPGTPLASWYGQGPVSVVSNHHQSVDWLPDTVTVAARAPDGVVEALLVPSHRWAVGVQYHPEEDLSGRQDPLWASLLDAARTPGAGRRAPERLPSASAFPTCGVVYTPFHDADRRSLSAFRSRVGSGFGDHRSSYLAGHLHGGVDLTTRPGEEVLAIGPGVVVDIHLAFPHTTVVVEHHLADGRKLYSAYKHLTDLTVSPGDRVHEQTRIGRVFDTEEQERAPWRQNHLHFEIRTRIDDGGAASWTSMSMEALSTYAMDPVAFFGVALR